MRFDETRASPVLVVGKEIEDEDDFGNDFRGWRGVFRSHVGLSVLVDWSSSGLPALAFTFYW
jgi:hypothetical protein